MHDSGGLGGLTFVSDQTAPLKDTLVIGFLLEQLRVVKHLLSYYRGRTQTCTMAELLITTRL